MLALYNFLEVAISVCLLPHRNPAVLLALTVVPLVTLVTATWLIAEHQRLQIVPSHHHTSRHACNKAQQEAKELRKNPPQTTYLSGYRGRFVCRVGKGAGEGRCGMTTATHRTCYNQSVDAVRIMEH